MSQFLTRPPECDSPFVILTCVTPFCFFEFEFYVSFIKSFNQGIADMELPDNLLAELEILENITSCNKVLKI